MDQRCRCATHTPKVFVTREILFLQCDLGQYPLDALCGILGEQIKGTASSAEQFVALLLGTQPGCSTVVWTNEHLLGFCFH